MRAGGGDWKGEEGEGAVCMRKSGPKAEEGTGGLDLYMDGMGKGWCNSWGILVFLFSKLPAWSGSVMDSIGLA